MQSHVLAIFFALLSALTIAWGTVIRHRIAEVAPEGKSPVMVAVKRPVWWLGMGSAIVAYMFQIVALSFGPLLVVQPCLVMSLTLTLIVSAIVEHRRFTFAEGFWSTVTTLAVLIVVLLGRPQHGNPQPDFSSWVLPIAVGAVLMLLAARWSSNQIRRERAFTLGLITGAVFGYVALFSKAVADILPRQGVLALVASWELYALIAASIIGTLVQQYAFNAGALRTSLPAMKIGEPMVAFSLGYLVLGERFHVDGPQIIVIILAIAAMIWATLQLSRVNIS